MRNGQRHRALRGLQVIQSLLGEGSTEATGGAILFAIRKQEQELRMLVNPQVTYARNNNPDRSPRPPPKSFAEFESDRTKPIEAKATFVPKDSEPKALPTPATPPRNDEPSDHEERNTRQRLGFIETRLDSLENMLEDLTELVTKPKASAAAPPPDTARTIVTRLVQLSVVEGLMSPEAALRGIAIELGLVEAARAAMPPPPRMTRAAAPVRPRRPLAEAEEPEEDEDEAEEAPAPDEARRPWKKKAAAQDNEREAFRARLEAAGLSQNKFAEKAGMHQGTLSRWARGGGMSEENLSLMRKALAKLS